MAHILLFPLVNSEPQSSLETGNQYKKGVNEYTQMDKLTNM